MRVQRTKVVPTQSTTSVTLGQPHQVLALLLGSELLRHTTAGAALKELQPKYEERLALLASLESTGHVVGDVNNFRLSQAIYQKAAEELKDRLALKSVLSPPKAPTPVHTLVRAFKAAQAPFPLDCRATKIRSAFVFFRALSKQYHPDDILKEIPEFAKAQRVSQTPNFNVEFFARFLKGRIQPK